MAGAVRILGFFFLLAVGVWSAPQPKAGVCSGPHTQLMVSPVVEDGYTRRITFDWEELPSGAEIGIFTQDPSSGSPSPVFSVTPSASTGWGNTTIDEAHIVATELGLKARCLSLYIAYRAGGSWQGVSCLRTEPTWMNDLRDVIGGTRLRDLYIPGTHDSSAFKEYDHNNPDDPITKYSVTQDEPIIGQLIYGARYIDLRVGYYPRNDQVWWGNHGIVQFHPMADILADITAFLKGTNEIVILDVQEFPVGFGDDKEVHRLFIQYLRDTFGNYIVPNSFNYDSTLNQVWGSGGRLIIGYDDGQMVSENNILWPAVRQMWGEKQHVEDLMEYLQGVVNSPPTVAWSAMAQLTPSALDIVLNTMKGLRHAAEAVNHEVTQAFRTAEWARNTNVLAIDFLRGSGAVKAALQWNAGSGAKPCYS